MSWTRTSIKGFKSTIPKTKYGQGVGTGIASTAILNETVSQVSEKLATPGAFIFLDLDDVNFNSSYSTVSSFASDGVSEWFRDYGTWTDELPGDDPEDGDVDSTGMSAILSADQKTQFASLLDEADDLFTFDGVNAQGNGDLVHSDGFILVGVSGTMVASNNTATLTGVDDRIANFKAYLPITCVVGTNYIINLELLAASQLGQRGYIDIGIFDSTVIAGTAFNDFIAIEDIGAFTSPAFEATVETMYFHIRNKKDSQNVEINDLSIIEVSSGG